MNRVTPRNTRNSPNGGSVTLVTPPIGGNNVTLLQGSSERIKIVNYHDVASSSASPEWPTPQWLVDQLAEEFGEFDLDPCATSENTKAPLYYTAEQDGLSLPWNGRVWLNPPYGRTDSHGRSIAAWMAYAVSQVERGNADLVVSLVPARVDTQWWRDSVSVASLVRILPGRIKWRDNQPAPFGNAVIVFGDLGGKRHGCVAHKCFICNTVFFPARPAKTCSAKCRMALSRRGGVCSNGKSAS